MSMDALLWAVKARLQAALGLDDNSCDVTPDGQPPPFDGEWFFAVHAGGSRNASPQAHRVEEYFGLSVTVTRRSSYAPSDRHGPEVIAKRKEGLLARARKAAAAVHGSYTVLNAANGLIDEDQGAAQDGFVEPLLLSGISRPGAQTAHWFWAEGGGGHANQFTSGGGGYGETAGWSVEVSFRDAMREQKTQGAEVMT